MPRDGGGDLQVGVVGGLRAQDMGDGGPDALVRAPRVPHDTRGWLRVPAGSRIALELRADGDLDVCGDGNRVLCEEVRDVAGRIRRHDAQLAARHIALSERAEHPAADKGASVRPGTRLMLPILSTLAPTKHPQRGDDGK